MTRIHRFRFLDNSGRARLAVVGLSLGVIARLVVVGWFLWILLSWGQLEDVESLERVGTLLDRCNLAAIVIGAVFFVRWFRRAYENAMACGMPSTRDPGHALVVWFVPILNLIEPAILTNAMWAHAGQPRVGRPLLVWSWWVLWIVPNLVVRIVSATLGGRQSEADAIWTLQVLLVAYAANAVAGVLAMFVVRRLTRAHADMRSLDGIEAVFGDASLDQGRVAQANTANVVQVHAAPSAVRGERQVEGSACAACGSAIDHYTEASVCTTCDQPFHDACLSEGACPQCRGRELDAGFQRW
jgi:hypothetical protein